MSEKPTPSPGPAWSAKPVLRNVPAEWHTPIVVKEDDSRTRQRASTSFGRPTLGVKSGSMSNLKIDPTKVSLRTSESSVVHQLTPESRSASVGRAQPPSAVGFKLPPVSLKSPAALRPVPAVHATPQSPSPQLYTPRPEQSPLDELVVSERAYVNDLRFIVESLYRPVRDRELLSRAQITALFSNIETILTVNDSLLKELEALRARSTSKSLAIILSEAAEPMKLYAIYCGSHLIVQSRMEEMRAESPEFGKFVREVESSKSIDFESYLIKPYQRLCKYPVLLNEILRRETEGTAAWNELNQALSKMRGLVEIVNNRVRRVESAQKFVEITERIENHEEYNLLDYSRDYLFDGQVTVDGKAAHLVLYSDVLVNCEQSKKQESKLHAKRCYALVSLALAPDLADDSSAFELVVEGAKMLAIDCGSAFERRSWLKHINSALEKVPQSSREILARKSQTRKGFLMSLLSDKADSPTDRHSDKKLQDSAEYIEKVQQLEQTVGRLTSRIDELNKQIQDEHEQYKKLERMAQSLQESFAKSRSS